MEQLTEPEIRAGLGVAWSFWEALGADDDATIVALLAADPLDWLGAADGVAARIRAHLEIAAGDCSRLGLISQVSLLPDRQIRPTHTIADEPRPYGPGEIMEGWRIELAQSESRWVVDPIRAHLLVAVATMDSTSAEITWA
jgi:hypothetical protein